MKRIWNWIAMICVLTVFLCVPVFATENSAATPLNDFSYTLQPSGKLLLTEYTGKKTNVNISGTYWLDGVCHPVVVDAYTIFRGNQTIEQVTLGEGVGFFNNTAATLFAQCPNLRSVVARNPDSSAVVSMEYMYCDSPQLTQVDMTGWDTGNVISMKYLFSGCKELKKVIGYQQWNTGKVVDISFLFNNNHKLKTVDLRNWNLSAVQNSGWCFQNCYASSILLPDSLAIISAGFLNHAVNYTGSSFTVPAGVKTVGYAHTFYDFATEEFKEFRVAEGNQTVRAIDSVLYSGDGRELLAIPRGKEFPENTYEIPEGVSFLGELSFSRNYNVQKVILPNSYLLKTVGQYDSEYITYNDIGNLNQGLNLNIAIYLYTGITEYAVKEDNPNYTSLDGVIYSKDMTTVLAVPTRYQGYLNIPEGVTVWRSGAMWCGVDQINNQMKATGVRIPSTMTYIASGQLNKLNWLKENVPDFQITVSKNNPAYCVDKDGKLAKKNKLNELNIQLQSEGLVYDGTPKTPKVTVIYKNKTLRKGKDYTLTYIDNVDAGIGWVRITVLSDFHGTVERAFAIEKALPEYTAPQSVDGIFGQVLQEVTLPEGFYFTEPMQWVGNVGENIFLMTYSNGNPNYRIVEDIPITVRVAPKAMQLAGNYSAPLQIWTGKPICPKVSVADGGIAVTEEEYTVTYASNTGFGGAAILVTDNPGGNFNVSGTLYFWILPDPLLTYLVVLALLTMLGFWQNLKNTANAQSGKQPKSR